MLQLSSFFLVQLVWTFRASASIISGRVTIPAPIVVEPSQSFDGNDGPFSSFNISVGTPPQNLKVFVSTSIYQTLVVVKEGCGAGTPSNCAALRGGEFSLDNSSTWQNNTADVGTNIYPLLVDTQLGYNGRAELGFDVVSLAGTPGATLKNQTVGGFAATDTYLGLFGIDPRSSNFTNTPPIPSYLQNLRNQSLLPSLSWGFTAGNQYRFDKVFGSLTLGGYDRSRFTQHDGSWPIDGAENLAVQLQSITGTTGSNSQGLLPTPIIAILDSSLPYIWLPREACLLFENAFGLEWDDASQLYLVNDTLHTTLEQQNTSLTFNLGGMTGGSSSNVNITLPYAAFDLTASAPLVTNATRYYPLKRAANSTQYVLGRTFFQEAYVIADYERRNFSLFPCKWEANPAPDIVSTFSPTYGTIPPAASPTSNSTSTSHSKGSSNTGAIAGGVVAGIAALPIIAVMIFFCWWRPKRRQHYTTNGEKSEILDPLPDNPTPSSDEPHMHKAELDNTQRAELEGCVAGPSHGATVFEMPAREEVASELRATNNNVHEMSSPDTASEAAQSGFPWKTSIGEAGEQSPSPIVSPGSPGSPGLQDRVSPMSSPSPDLPSPIPSPSMIPSSVPSPLPSPPPVAQPQPQKVVARPDLISIDSFHS